MPVANRLIFPCHFLAIQTLKTDEIDDFAKDGLLHSNLWPFAFQKAVNCGIKDGFS